MELPKSFGRYRVEGELGKGAMGRVYLAHDPEINRKVAIKTIHLPEGLSAAERAEAQARFQREVQAAGRLVHPHIITIFDVGQDARGVTFVAMEYVQGPTLEEWTRPGRLLEPRIVASIACQAADALAYAHRHKIVHRDIKPANLMIVGERTVKIADFGLAKPPGASLTSTGTLLGTPYYMSPEQIRGSKIDGRSDLFSLAIVVYELLTGKRPFRGDSISTVIYRIIHEPPVEPDLSQLKSGEQIKAFLARALAKKAEDRFQSGDEFARSLREAMTAPARAASPPAKVRGPKTGATEGRLPGRAAGGAARVTKRPPTAASARQQGRRGGNRKEPSSRRVERASAPARRPAGRRRGAGLLLLLVGLLAGAAFLYREDLHRLVSPLIGSWAKGQPSTKAPGAGGGAASTEVPESGEGPDGGGQAGGPKTGPKPSSSSPPGESPVPGESEAAAAPAPRPVMIRLASEPPGASFTRDGKPLPANRLPAPAEGEKVEVHAILGCREAVRWVTAADAGTDLLFHLKPASEVIQVVSEPAGTPVKVDGRANGKTPVRLTLSACEEHRLVLSRKGYRSFVRHFRLKDGRLISPGTGTLRAKLVKIPKGILQVPTPPYDMSIKLDGRLKVKPGEKLTLEEATYRLTFSNADLMFRREIKVVIHGDKTASPRIRFPPLAQVSIQAQPSNASIVISGGGARKNLGPPPIFARKVVAGTYTLKCTFAHNHEVQERTVTLVGGENPPVKFVTRKR